MYQTTLKDRFNFSGVGLHSGNNMNVTVIPAPENSGIQFKRSDVYNCPFVKATATNVSSTQLATTITCGDFPISTIEHLMSALYGLGIDNAYIEAEGPEIPILDGSAKPIVEMICQTGIINQNAPRKYLKITRDIAFEMDDKSVQATKDDNLRITFEIDYPGSIIGHQTKEVVITPESYKEIANARTFGFRKDVEQLHQMGLARGGSINNAIVIDDENGVLNPGGLRQPDEFVNHKILDLIGDFSLAGYRIMGHIYAKRSGHKVNNLFTRRLLESLNSYKIVELEEQEVCKFTA